jgi:cellulose synthase operon protein C
LRSARYENGKLAVTETAPEVVRGWLDDVDRAIEWVTANATICPLVASDDLPPALREYLRGRGTDIFDSLVLAMQRGILLVTDDLPTRELGRLLGFRKSAWLHPVFDVALRQRRIDFDTFIRWSAHLVNAGHNYIGTSGQTLARSVRLDAESGEAPGYFFKTLSRVIGGQNAEPRSHVEAVIVCLRDLWSDPATLMFRQPTMGLLLEQLVRERESDYALMLRAVLRHVRHLPELLDYLHAWVRGHFLPAATLD